MPAFQDVQNSPVSPPFLIEQLLTRIVNIIYFRSKLTHSSSDPWKPRQKKRRQRDTTTRILVSSEAVLKNGSRFQEDISKDATDRSVQGDAILPRGRATDEATASATTATVPLQSCFNRRNVNRRTPCTVSNLSFYRWLAL